jgi:hypothetical protein
MRLVLAIVGYLGWLGWVLVPVLVVEHRRLRRDRAALRSCTLELLVAAPIASGISTSIARHPTLDAHPPRRSESLSEASSFSRMRVQSARTSASTSHMPAPGSFAAGIGGRPICPSRCSHAVVSAASSRPMLSIRFEAHANHSGVPCCGVGGPSIAGKLPVRVDSFAIALPPLPFDPRRQLQRGVREAPRLLRRFSWPE